MEGTEVNFLKLFDHWIFKWKIINIDLCFANKCSLSSSKFYIINSFTNWYLKLDIQYTGKEEFSLSVQLCKCEDGVSKYTQVKFYFTLLDLNENIFWKFHDYRVLFGKGVNSAGVTFSVSKHKVISLPRNKMNESVLFIRCETYSKNAMFTSFQDNINPNTSSFFQNNLLREFYKNFNGFLVTKDGYIPVNKEFLGSCSSWFNEIFAMGVSALYLPYSQEYVMKILVFLYSGDISHISDVSLFIELRDLAIYCKLDIFLETLEYSRNVKETSIIDYWPFNCDRNICEISKEDPFKNCYIIAQSPNCENVGLSLNLYFSNTNFYIFSAVWEELFNVTSLTAEISVNDGLGQQTFHKEEWLYPGPDGKCFFFVIIPIECIPISSSDDIFLNCSCKFTEGTVTSEIYWGNNQQKLLWKYFLQANY